MRKKPFFKVILKKLTFSRNLDIYVNVGKKTTFANWSQNNVVFLEILILIMDKKLFFQNDLLYPEMLIFMEIWINAIFFITISRNVAVDICGDMRKKPFFKVISKKLPFSRNLDINVDMGKKLLLQSDLKIM